MVQLGPIVRAVVSGAAVLLAAELVLRFWVISPIAQVPHPRYGSVQSPHARVVQSREGYSRFRLNAEGLFDDEIRSERPAQRVLLLGDSFSAAVHVWRERSFAVLLERSRPGLEVVNAAHPGWSPVASLAYLEDEYARLAPDLVLFQVSDNDLDDFESRGRPRLEPDGNGDWRIVEVALEAPRFGLPALRDWLSHHSSLALFGFTRAGLLADQQRTRLAQKFAPGVNGADAASIPAGAAPTLAALWEHVARVTPRVLVLYMPRIDYARRPCGPADPARRELLLASVRDRGLGLLDPTDAFCLEFARSGQPLHGFHNSRMGTGHLNERGHRLVAERLTAALASALP